MTVVVEQHVKLTTEDLRRDCRKLPMNEIAVKRDGRFDLDLAKFERARETRRRMSYASKVTFMHRGETVTIKDRSA